MNKQVKRATILLGVLLAVLATIYIAQAVVYKLLIPTDGTIVTDGLTAVPTSIEWGNVMPGSTYTKSVTITNQDSVPHTLSMIDDLDSGIGTITWNKEDEVLGGGASFIAIFTLSVNVTATDGAFSSTITITWT